MATKSIFLFAPAETADVEKGPVGFAIAMAKAHGAALTIFTVALDVTTPERNTDASAVAASLRSAAEAAGVVCNCILNIRMPWVCMKLWRNTPGFTTSALSAAGVQGF